ncbi:GATOR1 complex protein NPRL3-like [Clytia hemisphaerica]|uniref:GATOR complex protein NPRL3 n=1 Tax=Clytia hemisphaerica TaxID=252671 RepID=A0A7M5X7Q9_9CNID
MGPEEDPISIFLVISGSRGQRMLFRYPFQETSVSYGKSINSPQRIKSISEDIFQNPYRLNTQSSSNQESTKNQSVLNGGSIYGFSDSELASLMAPKSILCDQKFELKIGHVKLIGYPVQVRTDGTCSGFQDLLELESLDNDVMINMVNVVMAIHANVDATVASHYQNICMMLGKALRHEEKRVRYLSNQHEIMVMEIDRIEDLPESEQNVHERTLAKSQLAKDIVSAFQSMCDYGIVNINVNGWLGLNYCFPHKIHKAEIRNTMIDTSKFNTYIRRIKPYHTLLLTDDDDNEHEENEIANLIKILPPDASPVLHRLITLSRPVKNFQTLCQDADISLPQIFQIVAHLIYWGKCIVIYPLAESNIYVLAESVPTEIDSKCSEEFTKKFPEQSLHNVFQKFSFPLTLGDYRNPLCNDKHVEHAQIVTWLLKKRLIKQLHTFVYMVPMAAIDLERDSEIDPVEQRNTFFQRFQLKGTGDKTIFDAFPVAMQLSIISVSYLVERDDMLFFLRMTKYFDGEHHLENIMYFENVSRSKLIICIDKFRSILITVQHQDAATVQLA